ncbi:MAG: hypothetical protein ACJAT4_001480 [Granulosicoccus sp.]|jgi:hypothetical protein
MRPSREDFLYGFFEKNIFAKYPSKPLNLRLPRAAKYSKRASLI